MKRNKKKPPFTMIMLLVIVGVAILIYTGKILVDSSTNAHPVISQPMNQNTAADILLVNSENPLSKNYQPENLISLYEQKDRHFQLAKQDIQICEPVFAAMEYMFSAAQNDGVDGYIIASGYRSFDEQSVLYSTSADGIAAKPGESEHETGLAFDVTAMGDVNFALTPQFDWLFQHCGEYGFILRYPENAESITGYSYEPWHYRYVGLPYSKTIMDDGITLEEYLSTYN